MDIFIFFLYKEKHTCSHSIFKKLGRECEIKCFKIIERKAYINIHIYFFNEDVCTFADVLFPSSINPMIIFLFFNVCFFMYIFCLFLNTQYICNVQFSPLLHVLQVRKYNTLKTVSNIVIHQYLLSNNNYGYISIEMPLNLVFKYQCYFDLS